MSLVCYGSFSILVDEPLWLKRGNNMPNSMTTFLFVTFFGRYSWFLKAARRQQRKKSRTIYASNSLLSAKKWPHRTKTSASFGCLRAEDDQLSWTRHKLALIGFIWPVFGDISTVLSSGLTAYLRAEGLKVWRVGWRSWTCFHFSWPSVSQTSLKHPWHCITSPSVKTPQSEISEDDGEISNIRA